MRTAPAVLYHFTCGDHGVPGIEVDGHLRPNEHPLLRNLGPVVWLTDLAEPTKPDAIGLTSRYLQCDRMAVRYVVYRDDVPGLVWWPFVRQGCDPGVVADLERYGWPTRWWLGRGNIPIRRTA